MLYCSTSLNTFRSAINFFTVKKFSLGENIYVTQLFKSFYKLRPIQSKYLAFWPVDKLLDLLSSWHSASSLSLKQVTLKTIALGSSDRGQTLHAINIEQTDVQNRVIVFIIHARLKTTRKVLKPNIVKFITTDSPELNVCNYVLYYLNRTVAYRADGR